jgi:hypothetical protein
MGGGHLNWLDFNFDGVLSTNALSPDSNKLKPQYHYLAHEVRHHYFA